MPRTRKGYRQFYSTNGIQTTSSGRKNQSKQTSVNGVYYGSRQTFSEKSGGKVMRKGQNVSRRKQYYDIRVGLGLAGG